MRDALNIEGDIKLDDVINQTCLDEFVKQLPAKRAKGLEQVRLSTFLEINIAVSMTVYLIRASLKMACHTSSGRNA